MLFLALGAIIVLGWAKVSDIQDQHPDYFSLPPKVDQSHVTVAGMEPQITLIREVADEHGWVVACEGKSGKMTALGLSPSIWPWSSESKDIEEELIFISGFLSSGPSSMFQEKEDCGLAAYESHSLQPVEEATDQILAIGTAEELVAYQEIAKSCELAGTRVQPITQTDRELLLANLYESLQDDWIGLYAEAKAMGQIGPVSCFSVMTTRFDQDRES